MTPVEPARAAAAEAISWAHEDLDLAYREIGIAVDADERTVRRWANRDVSPQGRHRAKLEEIGELRHLLAEVFDSMEEAQEWLHASVPAFRGRSPISLIRQGKVRKVVGVLATMESGAFL